MQISYDDVDIAFKLHNFVQVTFYHQCEELCIHLLEFICRACYIEHGIYILKHRFVSWFKILSQYDANTTFLLGFGMAMQNPSKFENILYLWIIYEGYCRCIV
jgi:hypothetical protein